MCGFGAVLQIRTPGGCEGGLKRGRPLLVGPAEPPHLVGGEAKVTQYRPERLAGVQRIQELPAHSTGNRSCAIARPRALSASRCQRRHTLHEHPLFQRACVPCSAGLLTRVRICEIQRSASVQVQPRRYSGRVRRHHSQRLVLREQLLRSGVPGINSLPLLGCGGVGGHRPIASGLASRCGVGSRPNEQRFPCGPDSGRVWVWPYHDAQSAVSALRHASALLAR